jgi:hypothetical protein
MDEGSSNKLDQIDSSEVQWALKLSKYNKACSIGNLNRKVFKHEIHSLEIYYNYIICIRNRKNMRIVSSNYKTCIKNKVGLIVKIVEANA